MTKAIRSDRKDLGGDDSSDNDGDDDNGDADDSDVVCDSVGVQI